MITIENIVGPSDAQMKFAIEGMRKLPICMRITAPLYWWKEFDTYKLGTVVSNSCITMHNFTAKEFTLDDFSYEHLNTYELSLLQDIIATLNNYRQAYLNCNLDDIMDGATKEAIWWQIIQTRNIMLNYEVLVNIYQTRKDHKLDEWRVFCERIEKIPCLGIFLRRMEEDK